MNFRFGDVLIWLIVGGLSGSLAGMLVTRSKQGFGRITNILLGLIGAVVGGVVFQVFNIDFGLGEFSISFEDLIAAFLGSIIVLAAVWGFRRYRSKQRAADADAE